MAPKRNFSPIYSKVVENDNDIVGMVAYALYKKDKLDYCKQKISQSQILQDSHLTAFHDSQNTPGQISRNRNEAEARLAEFFANLQDNNSTAIADKLSIVIAKKIEVLEKSIEDLDANVTTGFKDGSDIRKNFLSTVANGIIENVGFSALLLILGLIFSKEFRVLLGITAF